MENNIRLAFAVNNETEFEDKHFGDADKYLIYEISSDKISFLFEKKTSSNQLMRNIIMDLQKRVMVLPNI